MQVSGSVGRQVHWGEVDELHQRHQKRNPPMLPPVQTRREASRSWAVRATAAAAICREESHLASPHHSRRPRAQK